MSHRHPRHCVSLLDLEMPALYFVQQDSKLSFLYAEVLAWWS